MTATTPLTLRFSAVSDVGRVRNDNQDSGYGGPFLLAVCDGVGGAARGDIASSTAVQQLRRLDQEPAGSPDGDSLAAVAGALHRAHDRIGELVAEDPGLTGTSTTATLALLDGSRLALGHLGDSRAYLWRNGSLTQLTHDHTFVQSLLDEGRITEQEARTHPQRNLILKALDGVHETDPDLFHVDLAEGDRLLLCSDGACGVLDNGRLGEELARGTPEQAAHDLVRAALDAGSTDNVTCVVADLARDEDTAPGEEPLLVGAAAELGRRGRGGAVTGRFRQRSGDTGELPVVPDADELPAGVDFAIATDPLDPEAARYAPRPPRRLGWLTTLLVLLVVAGLVWIGVAAAWTWSQQQYFVGERDGTVTIYRGLNADVPVIDLAHPYATTDVALEDLPSFDADRVAEGIEAGSLADARRTVTQLSGRRAGQDGRSG